MSDCSTFRGVHTAHGKHGPNCSLPGPGARTLKQWPTLWQEVILHPLHQESLTLHAVTEEGVGLQVSQELHIWEESTHQHTVSCYRSRANIRNRDVRWCWFLCCCWLRRFENLKRAVLSLIGRLEESMSNWLLSYKHTDHLSHRSTNLFAATHQFCGRYPHQKQTARGSSPKPFDPPGGFTKYIQRKWLPARGRMERQVLPLENSCMIYI